MGILLENNNTPHIHLRSENESLISFEDESNSVLWEINASKDELKLGELFILNSDGIEIDGSIQLSNNLTVNTINVEGIDNTISGGTISTGPDGSIRLSSVDSTTPAIYYSASGESKSLSGQTACQGHDFTEESTRIRVDASPDQGLIVENNNEDLLMSVNGNSGNVYVSNNLTISNNLVVEGETELISKLKTSSYIDSIGDVNQKIAKLSDHENAPSINDTDVLGITGENGIVLFSGTNNDNWGEVRVSVLNDKVILNENLGVKTTEPSEALHVNGKIRSSDQVITEDGSSEAPAYSFVDDRDTGMYRSSDNTLTFVTDGSDRLHIHSDGNAKFEGDIIDRNDNLVVSSDRVVGTGDGLNGGGDLSENLELSVDNTVMRNNANQELDGNLNVLGTTVLEDEVTIKKPLNIENSYIEKIGNTNYKIARISDHPDGPSTDLSNPDTCLALTGEDGVVLFAGTENNGWGEGNAYFAKDKIIFNHDVGVKTNHPDDALHVIGRIRTDDEFIASMGSKSTPSYSFNDNSSTGFYCPSTNQLDIVTDGSVRMHVDDNGNIGINNDDPSYQLDVTGDVHITETIDVENNIQTDKKVIAGYNDSDDPVFCFKDNVTTGVSHPSTNEIALTTDSDKRLHVNSNGNIGIGTNFIASSDYKLDVEGDIHTSGDVKMDSDRSFKKNIRTLTNTLSKLDNINGVTFNWVDGDDKDHIGVIAQEVQSVFPELVSESHGKLSVAYPNMVAVLLESIKELNKKIENLTSDLHK